MEWGPLLAIQPSPSCPRDPLSPEVGEPTRPSRDPAVHGEPAQRHTTLVRVTLRAHRIPAMTPEELRRLLQRVAAGAARLGALPDEAEAGPPLDTVFHPASPRSAGVVADWVTAVAQRWGPQLDLEPRELGRVLAQGLVDDPTIAAVEVAPSGLLSITVADDVRAAIIDVVLAEEDTYALPGRTADVVPRAREDGLPEWVGDDPALRAAQLAHARLRRLARNALAAGVELRPSRTRGGLTHVAERQLLVALADTPHRLARHEGDRQQQVRGVTDLAHLADGWDQPLRPATVDEPVTGLHGARLALATAVAVVLRNGLARLGGSAPERM